MLAQVALSRQAFLEYCIFCRERGTNDFTPSPGKKIYFPEYDLRERAGERATWPSIDLFNKARVQ